VQNVFMTGATGFVGRAFAREFLAEHPEAVVWALARGRDGAPPEARPELRGLADHPRFHVVDGDLSEAGLDGVRLRLGGGRVASGGRRAPVPLDAVFHFAAQTEFKESKRAQTFEANLGGTHQLLQLLQALEFAGKLFYVSTAYVAGLRPGERIEEAPLPPPPGGYGNPYEASKHAAEQRVAASGLDWTILRLSIVVGDSRTGAAESDKMMYGAFKVYWRLRALLENKYPPEELAALRPDRFNMLGRGEIAKNGLCVDDVVRLALAVVRRAPPPGSVYHLVNPRPSTVGGMTGAMCDVLGLRCMGVRPEPPAHPTVEDRIIDRGLSVYRPYVQVEEPVFDQARLRALLGDAAVDAVLPLDPPRLRFLFGAYLADRLEAAPPRAGLPLDERLAHVQRHGSGVLAWSSLRHGVSALSVPGDAEGGYVPYAVKGRTAAMVGDPVCHPSALPAAVDAFLGHCARERLSPVAVQVTQAVADLLAHRGVRSNRMGDEAELDLASFDVDVAGPGFRKLRKQRNAVARQGVTVREATYDEVPYQVVERVSSEWLEKKLNRRELDLLMRPLPRGDEPGVRKFFAFLGEELIGFVIFNPLYQGGRVVGYLSDVERYKRTQGSVRDLIVLEAARVFRAEGRTRLSLGLAPLWNLEQEDHPAACGRVHDLLRRIRDEVAPVYNFEGVSRHKEWYAPTWKTTYLCTGGSAAETDMLNVFGLIGLLPPEALSAVGDATLDLVQGS